MARKKEKRAIKIFAVYHHDAAFLDRLSEAVERDETMPLEWRTDMVRRLREVSVMFKEAASLRKKT